MLLDRLLEHILLFFHSLTDSYGISIILLSLVVSIILLPLFLLIEKSQVKGRNKKALMQVELDKVSNLKNKQEKYFYTKEIYKKHHYNPYGSLIGLLGLLVQIPFFLAAYIMFEQFEPFVGLSFGPIADLSKPDKLLLVRGVVISLLPILMFATNLLSIKLYSKNTNYKEKTQLIVIAIVFFALLYNTSAALVLYWTMNNVFSIGKNWLLNKVHKETAKELQTDNTSLTQHIIQFLKKHQREIYATCAMWSIYMLAINIIIDTNLSTCFTSIVAALLAIILMDVLILASIIKAYRSKEKGHTIILICGFAIALSHLSIIYGKFSSLAAYDFFKIVLVLQTIYLITYFLFQRNELKYKFTYPTKKLQWTDLFIFLIITFPLITYLFNNIEYFTNLQSNISYFVLLIGIPLPSILLLRSLFKSYIPQSYIWISLIAISFTFYILPIITNFFKQVAETNMLLHFASLIIISIAFLFLYYKSKKVFALLSILLCCISTIQPSLSLTSDRTEQIDNIMTSNSEIKELLSTKDMEHKPDIFLLIYDAYTNLKQMKYYGIDNQPQESFLERMGFTVYNDIYTQFGNSLGSMSRVLDMTEIPNNPLAQYRKAIGTSTTNSILQKNGYKTHYFLSSYFYSGCSDFEGDYRLIDIEKEGSSWHTILQSIIISEFKYNIDFRVNDLVDNAYYNDKMRIIKMDSNYPKFIYSHIHNPGHSQNSGKCIPKDLINYHKNVELANQEMREDVEAILSMNREAIIILAGDHGPYLTGDCHLLDGYNENHIYSSDLADRFGVFLAIKYPQGLEQTASNTHILQDVFFAIFSDLCESDDILEHKLDSKTYQLSKSIPQGAIKDGVIQYGIDKGKPLYWDINQ